MNVDALLISLSPVVVYVLVALVIGLESMGIPLPGEVILVSAALLASRQDLDVSPVCVAVGTHPERLSAVGSHQAAADGPRGELVP